MMRWMALGRGCATGMALAALAALGGAGCGGGNSVNGEVDGDQIEIKSGYFAQEDDVFEGGDGAIIIALSSVDDLCALESQFYDEVDEDEADASDYEDAWQEVSPEDFWYIQLVLRVGDPGDSQDDETFDGVAWDEGVDKDGKVYGIITHYTDLLDKEYWDAAFGGPAVDVEDYYDRWYTDGGDLEITKHTIDEKIGGSFETEAAETNDGDTAGEIVIDFSVDRCVEMENNLFD